MSVKKFMIFLAIALALFVAMPLAAAPPGGDGPVMMGSRPFVAYNVPALQAQPTALFEAVLSSGSSPQIANYTVLQAVRTTVVFSIGLCLAAMLAGAMRKAQSFVNSLVPLRYDPRNRMTRLARDQTAYS
jgi:hypothetical protein